ncbi:MAG: disaggregatase related repeat-containing protein [Methanosarcina sp.]|uniref:disaggregatase related repeat-containing protein n=1 Tax=Methanosarcina sp. TaxID=2213 RepID=UPI0026145AC8|nr:disaggregatase related repeat-containing protein [Methanosarcina sp.]MDD3245338.1 disaggregatase related repeat-containing protein [Methanosarcina sp.]
MKSNVILKGAGDSTIIFATSSVCNSEGSPAYVFGLEVSNVEVSNLQFKSEATGPSDGGHGDYRNCIKLTSSTNSKVHDILFTRYLYGDGVRIGDSSGIEVYNCRMKSSGHDGVAFLSGTRDSRMYNCYVEVQTNTGVRVDNCANIEVDHNTFTGSAGSGWCCVELENTLTNVNVHHNIMHDYKGSSSSAGVGNWNAKGSINVYDNVMWNVSPYIEVGSGTNILGPSDHSVENWVAKGYGYGSIGNSLTAGTEIKETEVATTNDQTTVNDNTVTETASAGTETKETEVPTTNDQTTVNDNTVTETASAGTETRETEVPMTNDRTTVNDNTVTETASAGTETKETEVATTNDRTIVNDNTVTETASAGTETASEQEVKAEKVSNATGIVIDNRLREASPDTVYQDKVYIDIGGRPGVGKYRDLLLFDLSEYNNAENISNATLSLYWYYPDGRERPEDAVVEIYRPAKTWNQENVTWNSRDNGVLWTQPGGDWFDMNNVSQGDAPYATITLNGTDIPDNRYYELNVTDLVKEYVSDEYENTGFLIKTRSENADYVAFYSSEIEDENKRPILNIEEKAVA